MIIFSFCFFCDYFTANYIEKCYTVTMGYILYIHIKLSIATVIQRLYCRYIGIRTILLDSVSDVETLAEKLTDKIYAVLTT